ncbi:hypothetical protein BDP67DRAFT_485449 [Colletotrichum lupini]|nr:hypothetical protein BDP67DRAFT_485449 [Colletotrichum lupini]
MSPNKVPKKAGRRRSRPTVTADASDIFGPGAEVVGSIRAVFGPLISDIFSVPLILPEVPTWYAFSIPVNTKLEGGARSPATVLGLWENVMKSSNITQSDQIEVDRSSDEALGCAKQAIRQERFASLSERRSRPYVSTPLRTTDKGHPRTESNLEHGNESAGGGLTSPG